MKISYTRHAAGTLPGSQPPVQRVEPHPTEDGPLVSCLMVTRGNPGLVAQSLACFRAQTWRHKELVIVCDDVSAELRQLLEREPSVRLIEISEKLPLGDLRNLSVARSRGTYVCQWDDDDLYDPRRIATQVGVMTASGVMAVFLSRWLIWWPARDTLALSPQRVWEGSMLAHRSVIPVYPSLRRKEDTYVVKWITSHHATALLDCPQMYCYRITGENTWDEAHFDFLISRSARVFEDEEKRRMMQLPCFRIEPTQAVSTTAPA